MSPDEPRALGVIPARGASKRLPRKNILPVAGHPLIAYTIDAARRARRLTDWLVSSEDEEILAVARAYGAPTPFVRPAELAGDLRYGLLSLDRFKGRFGLQGRINLLSHGSHSTFLFTMKSTLTRCLNFVEYYNLLCDYLNFAPNKPTY